MASLLHRRKLIDHTVEAFVHLLLNRGVQLLVDRFLDFRELRLVPLAQLTQLAFQCGTRALEVGGEFLALLALFTRQRGARGLRFAARAGDSLLQQKAQSLQLTGLLQHHKRRRNSGNGSDGSQDIVHRAAPFENRLE